MSKNKLSGLGRRVPGDFKHVEKYPARAVLPRTAASVERQLSFSADWRKFYNQGSNGACVGFALSECMSILNRRRYDARWLWDRAKERDEWPDTNPGDNNGTSGRAGFEALRDLGHVRVYGSKTYPPALPEGISAFRWMTTIDEIRTAISEGLPVCLGTWWYTGFDNPVRGAGGFYWLPTPEMGFGERRGGHEICLTGASDRYQAFTTPNSWGLPYSERVPYSTVERMLAEDGDAGTVFDR